jgi:aminotransferase
MADVSSLGFDDDTAAARHLVEDVRVAAVPGSSFFSEPGLGAHLLRFAFPKRIETLEEAGRRLMTAADRS